MSRSIRGKVVLITGAGSGMGRAIAHLFADEGAHVAVTDLMEDRVDHVVSEIVNSGKSAHGWVLDVTDAEAINHVMKAVGNKFNGLDMVINNAGINMLVPLDAPGYEEYWEKAINVLLTAYMRVIRAALPYLQKSKCPRIVNISSTEGLGATKYNSAYSVAKHGVIGLTRALAVELGAENITVNCIAPGAINTSMTAQISEEDKKVFARRRIVLGRYAEPEEVAHAVLNFCLPASQYITGTVLPVDGGWMIRNA
jgi:3-oxoacyl-[acyl-carrier protein] reductase